MTALSREVPVGPDQFEVVTAAPQARALKARIVVHMPAQSTARAACDSMLTLVGHFMRDIGAQLAPVDLDKGAPRDVAFRPCMGSVKVS